MHPWVPFFQTLLWVALTATVLWWLRKQVIALLGAVHQRIQAGSPVRAGNIFELGESPPALSTQAQKAELQAEGKSDSAIGTDGSKPMLAIGASRALLAEELMMRELQQEFGVSINRQVALSADKGLDGIFVRGGEAFGVEMKYVGRPPQVEIIRDAVARMRSFARRYAWKRFTPIVALVCDWQDLDIDAERSRIAKALHEVDSTAMVRVYSFTELARNYGLENEI